MNDATEGVTVPMLIGFVGLLAYSGFFKAAREWVQVRLGATVERIVPVTLDMYGRTPDNSNYGKYDPFNIDINKGIGIHSQADADAWLAQQGIR